MYLLSIFTIESLCQKVCSPVFFDQRTFGHVDATSLDQFRERVFQTSVILGLLESCFSTDSVQFDNIIVETFRSSYLSGTHLACIFVVGYYGFCSLSTG